VIDAEPSLARELSEEEVDEALAAVGEFAELKSPWTMGHAAGVAALCAAVIDESASRRRRRRSCEGPRMFTISGGSVFRTRSGTSRDRSARLRLSVSACTPT
jgi:hypothetical protein